MKTTFVTAVLTGFVLCTPALAAEGVAHLKGTQPDSALNGQVRFKETPEGLQVSVEVANVSVPGAHGIHIHEKGSCEDMGKAAGDHFNPMKVPHGYLPNDGHDQAHLGDMGNIEIREDGTGRLDLMLPGLKLTGGDHSVVGRAVILHEKADDFGQPTGNAGGRIGCGIINLEETEGTSNQNQAENTGTQEQLKAENNT